MERENGAGKYWLKSDCKGGQSVLTHYLEWNKKLRVLRTESGQFIDPIRHLVSSLNQGRFLLKRKMRNGYPESWRL